MGKTAYFMDKKSLPSTIKKELRNESIDFAALTSHYQSTLLSIMNIVFGIAFASVPIGFILSSGSRGSLPEWVLYVMAGAGLLLAVTGIRWLIQKGPLVVGTENALYYFRHGTDKLEVRIPWKSFIQDIQINGSFEKGSILLKKNTRTYGDLWVRFYGLSNPYQIGQQIYNRIFDASNEDYLRDAFTLDQLKRTTLADQKIDFAANVKRIQNVGTSVFLAFLGAFFVAFSSLLLYGFSQNVLDGDTKLVLPSVFLIGFLIIGVIILYLGLKAIITTGYYVIGSDKGLILFRTKELRAVGWKEFKAKGKYNKSTGSIRLAGSLIEYGGRIRSVTTDTINLVKVEDSKRVYDSIMQRISAREK